MRQYWNSQNKITHMLCQIQFTVIIIAAHWYQKITVITQKMNLTIYRKFRTKYYQVLLQNWKDPIMHLSTKVWTVILESRESSRGATIFVNHPIGCDICQLYGSICDIILYMMLLLIGSFYAADHWEEFFLAFLVPENWWLHWRVAGWRRIQHTSLYFCLICFGRTQHHRVLTTSSFFCLLSRSRSFTHLPAFHLHLFVVIKLKRSWFNQTLLVVFFGMEQMSLEDLLILVVIFIFPPNSLFFLGRGWQIVMWEYLGECGDIAVGIPMIFQLLGQLGDGLLVVIFQNKPLLSLSLYQGEFFSELALVIIHFPSQLYLFFVDHFLGILLIVGLHIMKFLLILLLDGFS